MNILRLVYEWPPPWDGLAPGIYELTRAQMGLGNKVAVFCGGLRKSLSFQHLQGQALRVHRFPRALKRFSLFLTTAPAVLISYLFYRLTHKVDVVHGHGHITACFNLYKFVFGRLDKTPYVFHLHITAAGREKGTERTSLAERPVLSFWTKYFEWPLHKFSDRIGCKVADAVICTSESVKKEAINLCQADPQKVFVVENGVNTTLFASRKECQMSNVKCQILYVGALNERKNVDLLIEAVKFLPDDYQLTIVGRGSKEYQDWLHHLVEKWKLQTCVEFRGYVEYPKLPSYYQNADLLVLPSSYEGLPKVVLEALACGTPVLASGFKMEKIPGLHFLEKLDPKGLAAKIQEVVERREKGDIDLIRRKYDWSVKAREIQQIYQRAVS